MRATVRVLALPDRHSALDQFERLLAGWKRRVAMRSGNNHDHTRIADEQRAGAVHDGDRTYPAAGEEFLADPAHLGFRHLRIGLVVQAMHGDAVIVVAYPADEGRNSSVV